jgi:hypothetical protein
MSDEKEFVDFNKIQKLVGVTDHSLFLKYLKEVYKDLADRAESSKKKGITKMTFLDYVKLPIFISEKVFRALDQDRDTFLNPKEFIFGMGRLYNGSFEETIQIIFNLLDFNDDKIIEKDDVRIMLSYLPLRKDNINTSIKYKYQMESLDEIDELVSITFGNKNELRLDEFIHIIENKKSDVFLQILCFLYIQKPFTEDNINAFKDSKKKPNEDFKFAVTPQINYKSLMSPGEGKYLPSPSKKSSLSPASCFLLSNSLKNKFELNPTSSTTQNAIQLDMGNNILASPEDSGTSGMVRFHNDKQLTKKEGNYDIENTNINDLIQNTQNVFKSPSTFLKPINKLSEDKSLPRLTLENKLTQIAQDKMETLSQLSNTNSDLNQNNTILSSLQHATIPEKTSEILYEDYIYKLSENIKLKKYFLVLIGKDIYYYKNNKKETLLGMHNLSGCFVTDNGTKIFNDKPFYSFKLVFPSRERNYFCTSKETCDNFIHHLKQAFGYLNFFDYYEMLDTIGEGIFGVVKLGIYKKTKEKVAIKIIKKASAQPKDISSVKTEIDIMKLCHHPNIVRLLDHFENAEYIFIVMEYIPGGDLATYMNDNKHKMTEERACSLIYQIALGIKYLHQFGIVHRDLKPENIMLTEANEFGKVKIMDFGLSKILGSKEKSVEGFGTLTFVAPEVLVRTPYNKEIDIWSLGVILYLMLSGVLPFDDENDNEEVIAKLTVFSQVRFPSEYWSNRSELVIDLIKKCLTKDPNERIKIDKILEHEWIKQFLPEHNNNTFSKY